MGRWGRYSQNAGVLFGLVCHVDCLSAQNQQKVVWNVVKICIVLFFIADLEDRRGCLPHRRHQHDRLWAGTDFPLKPRACLNIKTVFSGMGFSIIKIRRSSDRLIFIMGIPILLRLLYIEQDPGLAVRGLQIALPIAPLGHSYETKRVCHYIQHWPKNLTIRYGIEKVVDKSSPARYKTTFYETNLRFP